MSKASNAESETKATIAEQAAYWWVALHGEDLDKDARRAFAHWTARSPQHIAAYLKLARAIRAVRASNVQWPTTPADDLIRGVQGAQFEVVRLRPEAENSWREHTAPTASGSRRLRAASLPRLVMAAAFGMAIALFVCWHTSSDHYTTRIGEQRSVALEDGSVITLNTSSEIEVRFSKSHRDVRLVKGEALFQVAHDVTRPFDVAARDAIVRAVGTEFNVDRHNAHTTVTVLDGQVAVTLNADSLLAAVQTLKTGMPRGEPISRRKEKSGSTLLKAAQSLVIRNGEIGVPQQILNVAPVLAWTQRKLVFDRRPIGEVAAEFNRYNRRQIQIRVAALANEPLTGVFEANDPQSFLTFLSHMPDVRVETLDSGDVVLGK